MYNPERNVSCESPRNDTTTRVDSPWQATERLRLAILTGTKHRGESKRCKPTLLSLIGLTDQRILRREQGGHLWGDLAPNAGPRCFGSRNPCFSTRREVGRVHLFVGRSALTPRMPRPREHAGRWKLFTIQNSFYQERDPLGMAKGDQQPRLTRFNLQQNSRQNSLIQPLSAR